MSCYGFTTPPPRKLSGSTSFSSPQGEPGHGLSERRYDEVMLLNLQEKFELMNQLQLHETTIRSLREQLKAVGDKSADLANRAVNENQANVELAKKLTSVTQQLRAAEEFESENLKLKEKCANLQEAIDSMREMNGRVVAKQQAEITSLTTDLKTAQTDLRNAGAKDAEQAQEISKLQTASRTQQEIVDDLAAKLAQAETTAQILKRDAEEWRTATEKTKAESAHVTTELRREIGTLQEQLKRSVTGMESRQLEIDRLQDELRKAQEDMAVLRNVAGRAAIDLKEAKERAAAELHEVRAKAAAPPPVSAPITAPLIPVVSAPPPVVPVPAVPVSGAGAISLDPENPRLPNARFERKLADGGQAVLWQGTYNSLPVAFKLLKTSEADADWKAEVEVLQKISHPKSHPQHHPNIIPVIAAGQGWFAFLFAGNGDLCKYYMKNGALPNHICIKIVHDIASGLQYLHNSGYIHRDLKSQNILLSTTLEPWICDFGLSCPRSRPPRAKRLGTATHMAPEMIRGDEYGIEIDIYALGIITWEVLAGQTPYQRVHLEEDNPARLSERIYEAVMRGERPTPIVQSWDPQLRSLMEQSWQANPSQRPIIERFLLLKSF